MNEQVQNYFRNCKLRGLYDLIHEACLDFYPQPEGPYLYLVAEGVGTGVKIPITQDDIKFIHRVLYLYKKSGNPPAAMPKGWQVLAAKYALLHPAPLHNYISRFDEVDHKTKIYEPRQIGGGERKEDHFVAEVGPEMYSIYANMTKKKVIKVGNEVTIEGMSPGRQTDEIVAKWWMDENKDCLHNYEKGKIPSPRIKILTRGTTNVSLAFRGKGASYQWYPVRNIYVNMLNFRKKVEDHGYQELLHAGHILRTTDKKWQSIMEPETIGKGGGTPNPALEPAKKRGLGVSKPKLKEMDIRPSKGWTIGQVKDLIRKNEVEIKEDPRGSEDVIYQGKKIAKIYDPAFLTPGHQEAEEIQSKTFKKLYDSDHMFKDYINHEIAKAIITSLPIMTKGNVRVHIYIKNGAFDISVPEFYRGRGIDESKITDIIQTAILYFNNRTGRISDADWKNWQQMKDQALGDWVRTVASGSTKSAIDDVLLIKKRQDTAFAQGQSVDQEKQGMEEPVHQGFPKQTFITQKSAEEQEEEREENRKKIAMALRNPDLLRSHPEILQRIKDLVAQDPSIGELLASQGIDINKLSQTAHQPVTAKPEPQRWQDMMDDDDDDYSQGNFGRYGKVRREIYSFRNYLNKRLNEMGVVWGNDKSSARKIKPGQTLKGGIQVFGAPWTVGGGPNYEKNDIKIKG